MGSDRYALKSMKLREFDKWAAQLTKKLEKENIMTKRKPSAALNDWKLTIKSRTKDNSYYFTTQKQLQNFLELNTVPGDRVSVQKGRFRLVKKYKVGA